MNNSFFPAVLILAMFSLSGCLNLFHSNQQDGLQCTGASNCTELGKECIIDKNYTDALNFFEKACKLNEGEACLNAGIIYHEGLNTEADSSKAAVFYEQACNMNYASGCTHLGIIYGSGSTANYTKAFDFYRKGCENGDNEGCYFTGIAYRDGFGINQNTDSAYEYIQKACDMNLGKACSEIGLHLDLDVTRDSADHNTSSLKYYEKACSLGDGTGCTNAGATYFYGKSVKPDIFKANILFERACDLNNAKGCSDLGLSYLRGTGIRQDSTKALELFGKACDLKLNEGCENYSKYKNSCR